MSSRVKSIFINWVLISYSVRNTIRRNGYIVVTFVNSAAFSVLFVSFPVRGLFLVYFSDPRMIRDGESLQADEMSACMSSGGRPASLLSVSCVFWLICSWRKNLLLDVWTYDVTRTRRRMRRLNHMLTSVSFLRKAIQRLVFNSPIHGTVENINRLKACWVL